MMKYLHFALGKYDYPKIEYLFGHLFYINTMFLIFSLIYNKENEKPKKKKTILDITNPQKIQKQLLISESESQIEEPLRSGTTISISVSNIFGKSSSFINDDDDEENDNKNNLISNTITNNIFFYFYFYILIIKYYE